MEDDCDRDTMQFSKNSCKRSIKKSKNLPYQTKNSESTIMVANNAMNRWKIFQTPESCVLIKNSYYL